MENRIPPIIEELYHYFAWEPQPSRWPDYIKADPIRAHGLLAFYRGLEVGLHIAQACQEEA